MRHFKHHTRRQWFFITCTLALLGTVAIIPWRVVAQEEKSAANTTAPVAANKLDSGKSNADQPSADQPAANPLKKLLVGRWRDAGQKEVIFFEDGTYEDFGANIFGVGSYVTRNNTRSFVTHFKRGQGRWILDASSLTLLQDDNTRFWNRHGKAESKPERPKSKSQYQVLRLDDSFLRVLHQPESAVPGTESRFFFRRIEEKPNDEKLAEVPGEMRQIADLAQLSTEETVAFATWLANQPIENAELQKIGRVIDARRRKITLTDLFDMNDAEVAAFRELLRQSRYGGYSSLRYFADGDQLAPAELQAFNKIRTTVASFDALAKVILREGNASVPFHGRLEGGFSYAPKTEEQVLLGDVAEEGGKAAKVRRRILLQAVPREIRLDRVAAAFADLERWFNETVFAVPSE
jgi:hypothetical protein